MIPTRLQIWDGEETILEVPLRETLVVGRGARCELPLEAEDVSRRHCRIVRVEGAFFVEDLCSFVGTTVNGDRITARAAVAHGDRIGVGSYILTFAGEEKSAPSEPKRAPKEEDDRPGLLDLMLPSISMRSAKAEPAPKDAGEEEPTETAKPGETPKPEETATPEVTSKTEAAAPSATESAAKADAPKPPEPELPPAFKMTATAESMASSALRAARRLHFGGLRLVFVAPDDAPDPVPFDGETLTLGSGSEADVKLAVEGVRAKHLQLVRAGDAARIETLDAAPVKVDGADVTSAPLSVGSRIEVGKAVVVLSRRAHLVARADEFVRGGVESPRTRSNSSLWLLLVVGASIVAAAIVLFSGPREQPVPARPTPPPVVAPDTGSAMATTDAAIDVLVEAAAPMTNDELLASAEESLEQVEFEHAAALVAQLRARSGLTPAEQVRAAYLDLQIRAALHDDAAARRACRDLAALAQQDAAAVPHLSPHLRALCESTAADASH